MDIPVSYTHLGDFGDFKKYMHILRNVEEELIEILHKIEVSGRKSLVLLCGSAGCLLYTSIYMFYPYHNKF